MIRAAGILFVTEDRRALFLKRGNGSDHPNEWAFPGGHIEEGETPLQAAERETIEEAGQLPDGTRILFARSIAPAETPAQQAAAASEGVPSAPSEDVDFTTFVQRIDKPFEATLCDEHTGSAWASIDAPPLPLHPGCEVALERLKADELGVARMMAGGRLTSPQRYENVWLFAIRITGTGVAYRSSIKEFVWRDPANYLNAEFLQRCNGLPVIWEHPEGATLNSKEFKERAIGTCLLPFIPDATFLRVNPKAKADEVWAIAKVYDDEAAQIMREEETSTSPSVVFRDPTVNSKMQLEDGSPLLVEGKPSLLDHIAICTLGVWDKAGDPSGVINDSQGDLKMDEEEKKAADADAGQKLDKILASLDSAHKRMDAMEERMADKRKDASEEDDKKADDDDDAKADKRKDGEEDEPEMKADKRKDSRRKDDDDEMPGEPKRVVADKRKDSRRKDDDDDDDYAKADKRKDESESSGNREREETAKADSDDDIRRRIAAVERALPREMSDADRAAMADAQERADAVFQAFGDAAPRPLNGEDLHGYRVRLANKMKSHSASFKDVNLHKIFDDTAFSAIESQIYADALAAAKSPADVPFGQLREIRSKDVTGRQITSFAGEPRSWLSPHTGQRRRLAGIRRNGF